MIQNDIVLKGTALLISAIAGNAHYHYVYCVPIGHAITSKPLNFNIYRSMMSDVIFNLFEKKEKK
ncbi:hypothetical protein [Flavobacterium sp. Arc2]|jgi:hypothetical protein|uniref:hypothetical protein n=1 Tax=Flavobacterium sp. Arc2 TaxID=3046685 RepID=UPI00352FE406